MSREKALVELVRRAAGGTLPWLEVGPGDDAAVISLEDDGKIVLTTDMVVEGVHYAGDVPCHAVARKAIARCLSDLAAMAASPLCTVAALKTGGDTGESYLRGLVEALPEAARALSAPLVGGDVACDGGPLVLAVTGLGRVGPRGAVRRSGARPGDLICVTGDLGGSIRGRHLTFTPRVREALELVERADVHAMIDVSDGLSTDLLHIARESDVAVEVRADSVPVSEAARDLSEETGRPPLWHALNDGEDYELLFCVSREDARSVAEGGAAGLPVTVIGEVTEGAESHLVLPDGRREELKPGGWEHTSR